MNHKRLHTVSKLLTLTMVLALCVGVMAPLQVAAAPITFQSTELLTKPTATSISITIVPNADITLFYEYDTDSGEPYSYATSQTTATNGTPKTVVISLLTANTRYFYRMQYSTDSGSTWEVRTEKSFWTQRATGSTFHFDVTSDAHVNILMGNANTWRQTLNNVAADAPDFLIDLGDTVAMRTVNRDDATAATSAYTYTLPFFNIVSASSPLFLVKGNHEQVEAWHLQPALSGSLPVIGTNAQKKYYPMPVPDGFYTGDNSTYTPLDGDDRREDYYAWTWGDALFVVIDPYWFTTTKPYTSDPGGGESDATGSGDAWDWTLGADQFNWLKSTLTNSTAKYKFVFSHQMTGDGSITNQEDYGHGGANHVQYVEWGGYDEDGTTWGWDFQRSGWGPDPVHQILADTHVTVFFHGHDHQYAYERLDDVIYQAVPSAGFSGSSFGIYRTGDGYTIQARAAPGHLRVTVGPTLMSVQYITSTVAATSVYSYTTAPTAIELTSLEADPARGRIHVAWDTADETGNLGFHVWRANSANGVRERVNESLIPSQAPGSPSGSHYEFVDDTAVAGLTYYYWVEQLDVSGATQLHGPISARASPYLKLPPRRE